MLGITPSRLCYSKLIWRKFITTFLTFLLGKNDPIFKRFSKTFKLSCKLKELRKDLVDVRNTLDNRMLDFVMGTHDRLGDGSRVSLLGRDTLSIIQDQLNIIDRDSHRDTWPRGEDARRAGERGVE